MISKEEDDYDNATLCKPPSKNHLYKFSNQQAFHLHAVEQKFKIAFGSDGMVCARKYNLAHLRHEFVQVYVWSGTRRFISCTKTKCDTVASKAYLFYRTYRTMGCRGLKAKSPPAARFLGFEGDRGTGPEGAWALSELDRNQWHVQVLTLLILACHYNIKMFAIPGNLHLGHSSY